MKKYIILIAFCILGISVKAQSKLDTTKKVKSKVEYQKVRIVPLDMYQYLMNLAWEYRENIDYIPSYSPDKKTSSRIKMKDNFEDIDRESRLDSVIIKKP